ncbi:MAG TPA: sigma-70 family RNA polymerase sigma factor [Bryobacterales bacterium]|nr:sigma-70 family RNA polymerase sigma factor [Bryobacterales bacterium]
MEKQEKLARFEQTVMPHLRAAYNLARWLARDAQDAEDIVQEAFVRAFGFFEGFHGQDARAWLLAIVRNTGYTWLRQNRSRQLETAFDEEVHSPEAGSLNAEASLLREADSRLVQDALEALPRESREVLVLRELEGLSYKQISEVAGVPLGTVMSRLARARQALQARLGRKPSGQGRAKKEADELQRD